MVDVNHLYTLHHTYTGAGCAHCGKDAAQHPSDTWLLNGAKVEPVTLKPIGGSNENPTG